MTKASRAAGARVLIIGMRIPQLRANTRGFHATFEGVALGRNAPPWCPFSSTVSPTSASCSSPTGIIPTAGPPVDSGRGMEGAAAAAGAARAVGFPGGNYATFNPFSPTTPVFPNDALFASDDAPVASRLLPPAIGRPSFGCSEFDDIIDARAPSDTRSNPRACNLPVLSDDERARVGTLYKRSRRSARKGRRRLGGGQHRPPSREHPARPAQGLAAVGVLLARGKRSGAFTHVLREIGWDARALEGGYKAFRRAGRELPTLAGAVCPGGCCSGLTGSGKSRLLATLESLGAQVLDLERLAVHRGSVLGDLPGAPQPTRKCSRACCGTVCAASSRRVRLRRIGKQEDRRAASSPGIAGRHVGPCVRLDIDRATRVRLLMNEYAHFLADPTALGRHSRLLRAAAWPCDDRGGSRWPMLAIGNG